MSIFLPFFSEDEKLQEAMMRDSEQKIEFLLSTVHRAVIMCQERNKGKGGGGDISGLVTNSILIC